MAIRVAGESRRSTRIPLQIPISVVSLRESLTCDGETIIVNRHGALIASSVPLRTRLKIGIEPVASGKRAWAKVVHIDPERPRVYSIALEKPENIWGVAVPPADWYDETSET